MSLFKKKWKMLISRKNLLQESKLLKVPSYSMNMQPVLISKWFFDRWSHILIGLERHLASITLKSGVWIRKSKTLILFLEKRAFLSTESENNIELEKKIEIRERQNGKIREQRNHEKSTSYLHHPWMIFSSKLGHFDRNSVLLDSTSPFFE